uniref:Uncharacterized protein n=1 Tax=Neospora caninum (strain Liverpool) TaxID=572307 RepID=A0A0F7U945_NEOCL|nr:TPA: hypothetical protein BN1204_021855 [Neospora caninum Liverpool]
MGSALSVTKKDTTDGLQQGRVNNVSRTACWAAKDEYFACLDRHDGDSYSECKEYKQRFEERCLPSWQKHFMAQRGYGDRSPR